MSAIKPCPCGKTPKKLIVSSDHGDCANPKWAGVVGDCCGQWEVGFRNGHKIIRSAASDALALAAWNAAPRAEAQEPQG